MEYLNSRSKRGDPETGVKYYSELDDERWDWRKVEIYPDGTIDFADDSGGMGKTYLSLIETPTIEEINANGYMGAKEITKEEFEELWQRALATGKTPQPMVEYLPVINDRPRLKDRQPPPG